MPLPELNKKIPILYNANMPNQSTIEHDDIELTELFKDFGAIFTKNNINKSNLDWSTTIDFQVFSEFLINDIHEMQERLKNPDDDYLYYACRHIFNIQDWIKLIVEDAGFQTFTNAWEHLFDENFGDKHILQTMYDACFEKWVYQKKRTV